MPNPFAVKTLIVLGILGSGITTTALLLPKSKNEEYKPTEEEIKFSKEVEEKCGNMDFSKDSKSKNNKGKIFQEYVECYKGLVNKSKNN